MPDSLDATEGFEFLFGTTAILSGGAQIPIDELDGFVQPAGRFALPHFAKAAPTQALQESIAGKWFGLKFDTDCHEQISLQAPRAGRQRKAAVEPMVCENIACRDKTRKRAAC